MSKLEIVRLSESLAEYCGMAVSKCFETRNAAPMEGAFGRLYHPAIHGERLIDRSFAIGAAGVPLLLFECSVLDGELSYFGAPVRIWLNGDQPAELQGQGVELAFRELESVAESHQVRRALIADESTEKLLDAVGLACLARGGQAEIGLNAMVDLTISEDNIRSGIRRRYKSMVNWGRKNLDVSYINAENPDRPAFDAYQRFHLEVAGRQTRPQGSWDVMFDTIAAGDGELIMANMKDHGLVAGCLSIDGSTTTRYVSGVFERSLFKHPIGHFPIFDSIIRAKTRGQTFYDLGEIEERPAQTEKERNIARFKKGFTSRVETRRTWTLNFRRDVVAEETENKT